jgi:outer membrane protein OmpA-like peptidoglycan-associated protein/outer membrane protein W
MTRNWSLRGTAAALAIAAASFSAPAHADGFYIGLNGGWNWAQHQKVDVGALGIAGARGTYKAKYDDGYGINGAVGYGWDNGFRTELEIGYKENQFKNALGVGGMNGRSQVWSAMANVYYDIPVSFALKPYVGGGLGVANWDAKGGLTNSPFRFNDDSTDIAWQAIAGVGYNIDPNWTLSLEYRYFETPLGSSSGPKGIRNDYSTQMALVGLRYNFGVQQQQAVVQRAVAPAPAPVQAPRSYLVFFDFDRSDLTPEGTNIVRTAASNAKSGNVTRIEVTGHADRSGSDAYNLRLSQRRAQTVQSELVRDGVPTDQIAIFAKGESQPLVPTPDGVREPQNRRVEIVYK